MLTIPNESALVEAIVATVYAEHGDKSGLPLDQLPPENMAVRQAKALSSLRAIYRLITQLKNGSKAPTGNAEIEGDQIVIRVGIPHLPHAVSVAPTAYGFKVTDVSIFAAQLVRALNREDEDGSTPIHRMFDRAFEDVIESDGDGIDDNEEEQDDADGEDDVNG